MAGRAKNRQVTMNDIHIEIDKTDVAPHDEEMNENRQVMSNGPEIESHSPNEFQMLHLNLKKEDTLDQRQEELTMEEPDKVLTDPMTKNHRVVDIGLQETEPTTTKTVNDIIADPSPIIGYADEPLLPLVEACAPLTDIIENLLFYVELALNETSEQPPDHLTIDESAAIRLYTIEWEGSRNSLYSKLNRALKSVDRENLRPYFRYLKLLLTALVKLPCVPPVTIWRGVTKNMSAQFPPGTRVTWWSFSSCTCSLPVLENNMYLGNTGNRTLYSVEAINGRAIQAHSHFVNEDELLLLPGTEMIVQSQFSPASDLYIIHLKQVVPNEVLLDPPFEGI
ncbi:unnamed protein product [Rotaria sp. Silwood2]|nr:unnamed protein product [Rotaria sp. Silwood2]CAF2983761.1 unnamed protein product [Rotaria sp. Silwood2]CAF3278110.1 unnamed protein product [Rotaria sp. Silwood2]CAF4136979.1 unnamed protein product [Rotaria sp. Silwood2]CAF4252274.1 unnamed protein product [Rotaria sp. Silwood2]